MYRATWYLWQCLAWLAAIDKTLLPPVSLGTIIQGELRLQWLRSSRNSPKHLAWVETMALSLTPSCLTCLLLLFEAVMSHHRGVAGSQATDLTGQPTKVVKVRLVRTIQSVQKGAAELECSRDLPISLVRPELLDHIQQPSYLLQASQPQPARRRLAAVDEQGFWERATQEQGPAGPLLFRDACDSKPWTADKLVVGEFRKGYSFPKNDVLNAR